MLVVRLLGGVGITVDGQAVGGLATRSLSLLARLLIDGRAAPLLRVDLAQSFWPDSHAAQARTNLRRELHALRAAPPVLAGCIRADTTTVAWHMPETADFDVGRFDALRAALDADPAPERLAAAAAELLAIDRGELLAGLEGQWVDERRREHAAALRAAYGQLAQACLAAGDTGAVDRLCGRWLSHDCTSEAAFRLLMQAHAKAGNRGALVQVWGRCCRVLEDELGTQPHGDRAGRGAPCLKKGTRTILAKGRAQRAPRTAALRPQFQPVWIAGCFWRSCRPWCVLSQKKGLRTISHSAL